MVEPRSPSARASSKRAGAFSSAATEDCSAATFSGLPTVWARPRMGDADETGRAPDVRPRELLFGDRCGFLDTAELGQGDGVDDGARGEACLQAGDSGTESLRWSNSAMASVGRPASSATYARP